MTHTDADGQYGALAVAGWRRGWTERPPPLADDDPRDPRRQARYDDVPPDLLPLSEALQACLLRSWPAVAEHARPALDEGQTVLLVGHGNALRALLAVLEGIGPREVRGLVLPTGVPRAYRLSAGGGGWRREPAPPLKGPSSGP